MSGPVVSTNVTIRMNEEELRKLDELARRMNKTRSDVIRDLISRFDEVLKEEVEKERRKWVAIGFVGALESAILDPEVIMRFVRRNVDILGFPDFLVGMVRVKNRVVLFSHHDRTGSQLLQLIRSRIEEEVRREEMEMEQEDVEDEGVNVGKATPMHIRASRPARPNTVRVAPVVTNHKLVSSNRAMPPTAKPTAAPTLNKPVNSNEGGGGKSTASTTAPDSKRLAGERLAAGADSLNAQSTSSTPRVSANDNSKGVPSPVGRVSTHGLAGDFVLSLVTHSYHKYRSELLRLVESIVGG